jgi:hypothetical protein
MAKLFIVTFLILNLISCKTLTNGEKSKESTPKVEFTSYEFGKSEFPKQKREVSKGQNLMSYFLSKLFNIKFNCSLRFSKLL